jgi:hypothetical protein
MLPMCIHGPSAIVILLALILSGWVPAFAQEAEAPAAPGLERPGLAGGGLLRSSDLYLSSPAKGDAASLAAAPSFLSEARATLGPTLFPSATIALGADDDHGDDTDGRARSYVELKAGPIWFLNDFDDLDVGGDFEGAFGTKILPFLWVEARSGYIWGGDSDSDLWAVPFLGNLKIQIPILLLKPYAGAGAGGFYIHTHESLGPLSASANDFVAGWNFFAGVDFALGPVLLGAEIKYLGTAGADTARGQAKLEGVSLLANLGFRF